MKELYLTIYVFETVLDEILLFLQVAKIGLSPDFNAFSLQESVQVADEDEEEIVLEFEDVEVMNHFLKCRPGICSFFFVYI